MASKRKGILRFVRLVYDKASGAKVRREVEGTAKGIGANLKKTFLKVGGVIAGAFAVRALIRFGKESVRVAAEADAIWTRLAQTVENSGVAFESVEGEINRTARALQDLTTVGDEDFAAVLQELITITDNYAASMEAVSVVADLAAAKQIDLRTAAQLVGRAMIGETSTLKRYGIVIQEGADALEVMRQRFKGMAENEAKSLAGQVKQLSNEWGDFQQAVGNALAAAGGGTSVIETLTESVKQLATWVERNRVQIQNFGNTVVQVVSAIARAVQWALDLMDPVGKMAREEMTQILEMAEDEHALMAKRIELAQKILSLNREQADVQAQLDKGPSFVVAGLLRGREQRIESEISTTQDLIRTINDLIDARNREAVAPTVTPVKDPTEEKAEEIVAFPAPPVRFGDRTSPFASLFAGEEPRGLLAVEQMAGRMSTAVSEASFESQLALDDLNAKWDEVATKSSEASDLMKLHMLGAAYSITEAFHQGFNAIWDDSQTLVDGFKGVGAGIVAGLSEGMAQYHTAQGIGKLAEGTWPPNPAAIAAAMGHFAAAGAFKALGSFVQSKARGGGGSGRAGSMAASQTAFRGDSGSSTEVHIWIDPVDPDNPLHQRVIKRGYDLAREEFGEQVPISVHRGRA